MAKFFKLFGWLLIGFLWFGTAFAEVSIPTLKHNVTDLAGVLSTSEIQEIERQISAFESEQHVHIVVLLVLTTEAESIEAYSARVMKAAQLEVDHIFFLIAKQDRKFRINVAGERLTMVLNDRKVQRIVSETITPWFKRGDFSAGIQAGINDLILEMTHISPI